MANTAQARKRARQAVKQNAHNSAQRSTLRTAIKAVRKAIQAGDKAAATQIFQQSVSTIDSIADKKIIHKNKAARHKSRINARIKARNKEAVMDALVKHTEMDVPKVMIEQDSQRLAEQTRQDMAQRGMDVKSLPFPADLFATKAERRVRLGLVVAELVRANNLQAKPEQIKAHIDELAASYEKPADVVRWYFSDNNRLAEVEAVVIENNVTEFVLSKAKVNEKSVSFDELMAQQQG